MRGCYLWTNKVTGKQYIGSSRNLSLRLAAYYRPSYLKLQSDRGSAISRALLKYGHEGFYLSILVLNSTPVISGLDNYSPGNIPDFVSMEQSFLDNYILEYNINRVASSKYNTLMDSVNQGVSNPSYDNKGEEAFVWDKTHSDELKTLWSKSRGKLSIFVYSKRTLEFECLFPSEAKLSAYLKISISLVKQIISELSSFEHDAIMYEDFVISLGPLKQDWLSANLKFLPIKSSSDTKGKRNMTIYGFNPDSNEYKIWLSKGDCLEDLTGYRYTNIRTINKRIDNNIIYKGFYLQTKPFKE